MTEEGNAKARKLQTRGGDKDMTNNKLTLEEATRLYVGKPYNYENERTLKESGFMPLLFGSKISMIRPIRKCGRFDKK